MTRSTRPRQRTKAAVTVVERGEVDELRHALDVERNNNEILSESLTDLERSLFEPGWLRLTAQMEQEFTADGLVQLRALCKLYAIKNPLVKRGLALRTAYVWGQGVQIVARANGRNRDNEQEQDVQAVVARFLADPGNMRSLTGPEGRQQLETTGLGTDGELFLACFTRPATGVVQVRTLPADEIVDVICNPEDAGEPWYYRRRWNRGVLDASTGKTRYELVEKLYPDIDYRPASRPTSFGQVGVAWDSPVLHVAVNRPLGWKRGIPDSYAAVDWARAYKEFLEDWTRLTRALSRYAWKATAPGSKAARVRTAVSTAPTRDLTGQPAAAGATAVLPPDVTFEAVSKSGATIDANSGRPLAMMVASALGVPVTMLLADPGQTGARATAETLDQPTELEMKQRRDLWAGVYQRLLRYVITESVRAGNGQLRGSVTVDQQFGGEVVQLDGATDTTVDITWPELDDADPSVLVKAIVDANSTMTMPPEAVLRLLLTALGVRDIDQLVESMLDEDGNFVWPSVPGGVADLGPMTPGDEPPIDGEAADGEPA